MPLYDSLCAVPPGGFENKVLRSARELLTGSFGGSEATAPAPLRARGAGQSKE